MVNYIILIFLLNFPTTTLCIVRAAASGCFYDVREGMDGMSCYIAGRTAALCYYGIRPYIIVHTREKRKEKFSFTTFFNLFRFKVPQEKLRKGV